MLKKYWYVFPLLLLFVSLLIVEYKDVDTNQSTKYIGKMPFSLLRMAPDDNGSIEVKYTAGVHDYQAMLSAVKYKIDTCQEYGVQLGNYPIPKDDINSWEKFNALIKYKVLEYNFDSNGVYEFWSLTSNEVGMPKNSKVMPVYEGMGLGKLLGGESLCAMLNTSVNLLLPVEPLGGKYKFADDAHISSTSSKFKSSMYYTRIDYDKVKLLLERKAVIESKKVPDLDDFNREELKKNLLTSYNILLEKEKNFTFGFLITKYTGEDHNSLVVVRDDNENYLSYMGLHDTFDIKTYSGSDLGKFQG